MILNHYNIVVAGIYDKEDYKDYGDKGKIMTDFIDGSDQYDEIIFVDDATEHLDSATDKRITGYRVYYEWDEQVFSQVTHEIPGQTIPVHIRVD